MTFHVNHLRSKSYFTPQTVFVRKGGGGCILFSYCLSVCMPICSLGFGFFAGDN